MKKFVICITGRGEGCDYTIACNKTYYTDKAKSVDDLIKALHEEWSDDYGRVYMSDCGDRELTYEEVTVYEYVSERDISDDLRNLIKADKNKESEKEKLASEQAEKELYNNLKKKYEKSA